MPRTTGEMRGSPLNVRLTVEEERFVKQDKGSSSKSDYFRDLLAARKEWFRLPLYQAERLEEDAKARGRPWFAYMQELAAERYLALAREESRKDSKKRK